MGKAISVESLLASRAEKIERLRTKSNEVKRLHEAISETRSIGDSINAIDNLLIEFGHDVSSLERIPACNVVRTA